VGTERVTGRGCSACAPWGRSPWRALAPRDSTRRAGNDVRGETHRTRCGSVNRAITDAVRVAVERDGSSPPNRRRTPLT